MILARYDTEQTLQTALDACNAGGIAATTYTPTQRRHARQESPIPAIMQAAFMLAAIASFALQSYSAMRAYPFAVGGRPPFAWPAFIPTAFENGVLAALVAGAAAFMICNRLPKLYDPVDEFTMMRSASRDGWVLRVDDASALKLIKATRPAEVKESWGE